MNAIAVVRKTRKGVFYLDLPKAILERLNLRPFMAAKMKAEKKQIRIFGFEKTVKIKLDLEKKTIALLKKIMKTEGYGSIDETVSNVVREVFAKKKGETKNVSIVYLYPEGFLKSKFVLIDDYEKSIKTKNREKSQKVA